MINSSVRTAAQLLIEEDLIYHNEKTGDSRRESRDSGRLLDKEGITQKLLNDLESNFLLRREVNSLGGISYEVSHDTLIEPILKSRKQREIIRLKEIETEKQRAAKRKRYKRIVLAVVMNALFSLALFIASYLYNQNLKLEKALSEADKAKKEAQEALNNLLAAQKAKEMTEFKIDLNKIKQVLQGGNCPTPEQLQKMKEMKTKYATDADLQGQIDGIPLGNCR